MNRTDIEYGTLTWNPVSGCLPTLPCYSFCWARRMSLRLKGRFGYDQENPFQPTLHFDHLEEPLKRKKPARILVVYMGDLFTDHWNGAVWDRVFDVIERAHWHTFILLTKRPGTMVHYWRSRGGFPSNCWPGVSVTCDDDLHRLYTLREMIHPIKWVSFEPLLSDVANGWMMPAHLRAMQWVVIGCQTGPGAPEGRLDWVKNLVFDCEALKVPVFLKDNAPWQGERPREFPIKGR